MSNPLVSIIVPVYNVENYIRRCMDSLINQSFNDIEIIAINDGSTDNSLNILREYEILDNRVRVINIENSGVSYCRNRGIGEAKGDFIVFVDSDDWIDSDMVESMYKYIRRSDMVMCTYIREFKNHSKEKMFNLPEVSSYKGRDIKDKLLRKLIGPINEELVNPEYLDSLGTVWAKMYRKDLLINNNIKFLDLDEIGSGEDTLFNIYALNSVKRAVLINRPMYHYWKDNPKSITARYIPNFKEKRKVYFNYIREFIGKNEFKREFEVALNNRICMSVLGMGLIECSKGNDVSALKKISNIKSILEEDYIKEAYSNLELKNFKLHWKFYYYFNKQKLALLSYIMINGIEFLRKRIA